MSLVKFVKQSNAITSGRYDYSVCQLDLIFALLSQLKDDDEDNKWYVLKPDDLAEITGRNWNIEQLKDNTKDLLSRVIEILDGNVFRQMTLFTAFDYYLGTGKIYVSINPKARYLFYDLKNNFTLIPLKAMFQLKSKYSKRLYALALQWKSVGSVEYDIEELKDMLGCNTKGFKDFSNFRKKILDVARKEIQSKTDLDFDYELIKDGRSFERVKIKCFKNKAFKPERDIDFKVDIEVQKRKSELIQIGVNANYVEILSKSKGRFDEYRNAKLEAMEVWKKDPFIDWLKYMIGILQKRNVLPKAKLVVK